MFALKTKPRKLNLFFVSEIVGSGAIGYGSGGVAIVCAEKSTYRVAGTTRPTLTGTTQQQIQMIAHEIGHYMSLMHPGTKRAHGDNVPLQLEDYWSRRSIMYAYTSLNYQPTWPDTSHHDGPCRQRGRQSDVGYGHYVGGPFLCCKPIPLLLTSSSNSEIKIARIRARSI